MDTILISQLRVETVIGAYVIERIGPQLLLMDIEFTLDIDAASESDQLADTVDYAELAQKIQIWSDAGAFHLIEALAQHLVKKILDTYTRIETVCLKIRKYPEGIPAASIAVQVARGRES